MTRWLGFLAAAVVAALPLAASAERPLQAPHDMAWSVASCDKCHSLYTTTSASGKADYTPGCNACHNTLPAQKISKGFPWLTEHQAVPGQGGTQHSWSGYASNNAVGAVPPPASDIAARLVDGRLQCIVCHDPHEPGAAFTPNAFSVSIPLTPARVDETGGTGTGQLELLTAGTVAKAYRVQVASPTTLVVSHDWSLATPTWTAPISFSVGAVVTLDDPAVTIRITGAPNVGDYWDFYMSYPFVRATMVADAFCILCHQERSMNHLRANGEDPNFRPNGVRKFSHAVGVTQGGGGTSRSPATLLDASGVAQQAGDTNKTNNLVLDANVVRCTTCHAVHNTDSNSLSVDAR